MARLLLLLLTIAALFAQPANAAQTTLGEHVFTLPDGFEIQPVAGPPLVDRPISAAFDEQGRLYVADSSGSNDKVEKQLAEKPHRIVRLEDTDNDGRFDKSVVFADRMMFPEGAMWLDGSLYVTAPPSIWKLTDTTGDGVADQREEWFKGGTLTGCANDLHGPFAGPDGWIYWCKGAFAEQTHERAGRPTIKDRAAHIFRCRPDGSELESVMSGGMDNPVEVAFTRTGEPIFTATFLDLSGPGKRDGLAHAVYGGVFPKVNDVTDGVTRTGPLLPAMTHFGPGAPSGICRVASAGLGEEFRDNLFATLFNLQKVTRHVLEPAGSTFRTHDSDFVVSNNRDFHPTDVLEDADGSLLIVDTGGWYKLCCPTSQLAKPDVLGAIYRVRKTGGPAVADPRGLKLDWSSANAEALVARLADSRPAVVQRAVEQLGRAGEDAVEPLRSFVSGNAPAAARQQALWALSRIAGPAARAAVQEALGDSDAELRTTAAKIAGLWRDAHAVDALLQLLADAEAPAALTRTAVEALGRIGNAKAIEPLFAVTSAHSGDRFLEHAAIFGLIEIGDGDATAPFLHAAAPAAVRNAAMIALDQMQASPLQPQDVLPHLTGGDAKLRETANWIVSRRPQWSAALAHFVTEQLDSGSIAPAQMRELEKTLARCAREVAVQEFLTNTLRGGSPAAQAMALRVMAQADLRATPEPWLDGVARALEQGGERLPIALAAARVFAAKKGGAPQLTPALLRAGSDTKQPAALRLEALSAVPAGALPAEPELFDFLRAHLDKTQPAAARATATAVLVRGKWQPSQREALADVMAQLGPLDAGKLLPVFENSPSEAVGRRLLAALSGSPALFSLQPQALRTVFSKFPASLQPECEALLAKLNLDTKAQRARLEAIVAELPDGDLRRGQEVFNSAKAACIVCHSMGDRGVKFGPDLTSIGQARSERDLLESIVFPSASFVRSYEPVVARTKSSEEIVGMLRNENDETITLSTAPGAEQRVARGDIAELLPGAVSLMPPGMDQVLTRQELADLLSFLKATKWGAQ